MNKYHAIKTIVYGITFDSKREASRYCELKNNPKIEGLELQVSFELAPSAKICGRKRPPLRYVADFVYYLDGKRIVEDCKGFRTDVYRIKRHLMKTVHGIDILES